MSPRSAPRSGRRTTTASCVSGGDGEDLASSRWVIERFYQASNWLYTRLSQAMPLLDIGNGVPRHSPSLAYACGRRDAAHVATHGVKMRKGPLIRLGGEFKAAEPDICSHNHVPVE